MLPSVRLLLKTRRHTNTRLSGAGSAFVEYLEGSVVSWEKERFRVKPFTRYFV